MSDYVENPLDLQEIRARYREAETSLREMSTHLQSLSQAREIEEAASGAVKEAAVSIGSLAGQLAQLVEALRTITTAADQLMAASSTVLNSSDLAEMRTAITQLRNEVKEDSEQTRRVIDAKVSQFHGALDGKVRTLQESLEHRLQDLTSEFATAEGGRAAVEKELAQTRAQLDAAVRLLGRKAGKLPSPPPSRSPGDQESLGFS